MSDNMKCETCAFALGFSPPNKEPPKPTWFGGTNTADHWMYELADYKHTNKVRCRRYPEQVEKYKSSWCGEYKAKGEVK